MKMQQQPSSYSVEAIASCFLHEARAMNQVLTNLRLQKLIYFAHGFYLALTNRPLVNTLFEAWDYGPVLRTLYNQLRGWEAHPLPITGLASHDTVKKDSLAHLVICKTLEKFKNIDTMTLVDISHKSVSPWSKCRALGINIISNDLIKKYFDK